MRILYLAPLIPSTSGSGGRRAAFNHLIDLARSEDPVEVVCVDVEGEGQAAVACPGLTKISVFARSIPRARSVLGRLRGMMQLLFDPLPRAASVVASKAARAYVRLALSCGDFDIVVVDHLSGWSLLRGLGFDIPICYVAHNVETDILLQQIDQLQHRRFERYRLRIEAKKTARLECELLQRSDAIIAIASTDLQALRLAPYLRKAAVWPELPTLKTARWFGDAAGHLLFVGSAHYHPNLDAIEWLVTQFMPSLRRLAPRATLRIAGTAAADVPHLAASAPGVIFEGFVNDNRLEELHVNASLFVSPVVLGSGIKIKVLEAASYGVPVAATRESLQGIDFLTGAALSIPRNASEAAAVIAARLADRGALVKSSAIASGNLRSAIGDRPAMTALLRRTLSSSMTVSR